MMNDANQACLLAIDQGTTSSRAIIFSSRGEILAQAHYEFPQFYPKPGWVEHDPEDIWETTLKAARTAFNHAEAAGANVIAIGITNQRETTIVWDKSTGHPICNAIVWQDRRTVDRCEKLRQDDQEKIIRATTGLVLDPYFSATKIAWILDHVEGARTRANHGELAFGTVDSFLVWRLTGGKLHATDATNASRTSLFDIKKQVWDEALADMFRVPLRMLPEVLDSADDYGETRPEFFGRKIPIYGVVGDQQGALIGQCCFKEGDIKSTYGTGCFVLMNSGDHMLLSKNRLLTTLAYRINSKPTYALEGSIFAAGSAVQWLRDGIKIVADAPESEILAASLDDNAGVYLVPAFTGLGAPHWDPDARAAIFGMTRATGRAELARAALESVCFQTSDLFAAMAQDGLRPQSLKVDGGMTANGWMLQFLADLLDMPVKRPKIMETTALGAACLAGLKAGLYRSLDDVSDHWQLDSCYRSVMEQPDRHSLLTQWHRAVKCTRDFTSSGD